MISDALATRLPTFRNLGREVGRGGVFSRPPGPPGPPPSPPPPIPFRIRGGLGLASHARRHSLALAARWNVRFDASLNQVASFALQRPNPGHPRNVPRAGPASPSRAWTWAGELPANTSFPRCRPSA